MSLKTNVIEAESVLNKQGKTVNKCGGFTSDPTVTDDSSALWDVGDFWVNTSTDNHYVCLDNSVGAAVWKLSTIDKTLITDKVAITGEAGDYVLVSDASDAGNLKKLDIGSLLSGGGGEAGAVLQAKRTTLLSLTATPANLVFDTTDIETDDTIIDHSNIDRERLIVGVSEYFFGSLNLEFKNNGAQDRTVTIELRLNGTTTLSSSSFAVSKSTTEMVNRTLFLPQVTAGDYFSIRVFADNTGVDLEANARLCVFQLKGKKGDPGPQGADGDITWEGSWQNQDYVANQAVSYTNGSSYVCHTNTTANQPPTDVGFWDVLAEKGDVGTNTFTDYVPLFRQNSASKQEASATYVNQGRYAFRGTSDLGLSPTNIKIVARVSAGNTGSFRIYDITNAATICEITGLSNTSDQLIDMGALSGITTTGAVWELQARNNGADITFISGVSIKYG